MLLPLWLFSLPLSLAQAPEECCDGPAPTPSDTLGEGAEALPDGLTRQQFRALAPTLRRLPAPPRRQVDFTAYTLEWGEWRIGTADVSVGVLPRTQLTTTPLLDAAGVYNGELKLNPLRVGPVDLGLTGGYHAARKETWQLDLAQAGGTVSVQVAKPVSLHLGADYYRWDSVGMIGGGASRVDQALTQAATWAGQPDRVSVEGQASVVVANAATDLRFNRKDSLILQGSAAVWGQSGLDAPFQPLPQVPVVIPAQAAGAIPLRDAYITSLSWQRSGKHLDLRVGGGVSSVPGAWVFQSTEVAMRFGGSTRDQEDRLKAAWRANRKDLAKR